MKKQLLPRISFALVICALFGMTGCGNLPQTIPDKNTETCTIGIILRASLFACKDMK